jgi:predicted nuclease of predicted toxin-antitoxin system
MILLDQGLPRTTVPRLRELGLDAEHVGDCGLATADDRTILDRARQRGEIVVTLDADFHAQLALSGAAAPSVIRIRIEGLKAEQLATLLRAVVKQCGDDLKSGAMVSVTESGVRLRRLPLLPF